jgi:hypothetical protein
MEEYLHTIAIYPKTGVSFLGVPSGMNDYSKGVPLDIYLGKTGNRRARTKAVTELAEPVFNRNITLRLPKDGKVDNVGRSRVDRCPINAILQGIFCLICPLGCVCKRIFRRRCRCTTEMLSGRCARTTNPIHSSTGVLNKNEVDAGS